MIPILLCSTAMQGISISKPLFGHLPLHYKRLQRNRRCCGPLFTETTCWILRTVRYLWLSYVAYTGWPKTASHCWITSKFYQIVL